MFGSIGGPEILFILVLALLLFGPRKLPQIGRTIGRTMSEFRRAAFDFRSTLEREIETDKLKEAHSAAKQVANVARRPWSLLDEEPSATDSTEPGPTADGGPTGPRPSGPVSSAPGDDAGTPERP